MSPMPLLALGIISSTWQSKVSLLSNNKPKLHFTASHCEVIKINGWCIYRVNLTWKVNFHSLLRRIGIKLHLPLIRPSTLPKSVLSFAELSFGSQTRKKKRKVSSAKIFTLHSRLAGMSLIKIRNNRGPKTEPWGTLVSTFRSSDGWPFKTTLWSVSERKLLNRHNK